MSWLETLLSMDLADKQWLAVLLLGGIIALREWRTHRGQPQPSQSPLMLAEHERFEKVARDAATALSNSQQNRLHISELKATLEAIDHTCNEMRRTDERRATEVAELRGYIRGALGKLNGTAP